MPLAFLVWAVLAAFIASRAADFMNRVLSTDPVAVAFAEGGDDAYYYLAIARNIGAGKGITIDGEHWTTGFQPLWQAVTSLAFLVGRDERTAFALVYLASFACWLAGLLLFLRFVRIAATAPLPALAPPLLAAAFLCEAHLNLLYFSGLDAGLALTLGLALMVAFHDHLRGLPATPGRLAALGALAGLFMLARNDGVFLFVALMAVTLLPGTRPRPLREGLVIGLVASLLVLPWLAYCQLTWGYPMPQSGVATSNSLYPPIGFDRLLRYLAHSLVPIYFVKQRGAMDALPIALLVVPIAAVALGLAAWRWRDRSAAIEPRARLVLAALAAACLGLLAYYQAMSGAGQFFTRYFAPMKLLALIVLSLFVLHAVAGATDPRPARLALPTLAMLAIGSNLYWVWRDHGLPYRSYLGFEVYEIARTPLGQGTSRIGAPESGRLGYRYPARVVNLDGKARVDALAAMRKGEMAPLIRDAHLDWLLLSDEFVAMYDRVAVGWRDDFQPAGRLGFFNVFARTRGP